MKGPLPDTFADFWRLVWEQHCPTIVMMTKLEERNRVSNTVSNCFVQLGTFKYHLSIVSHNILHLSALIGASWLDLRESKLRVTGNLEILNMIWKVFNVHVGLC